MRAYYLGKETGRNFGECLATVFADRIMDLVTILVAGLITTIIFSAFSGRAATTRARTV